MSSGTREVYLSSLPAFTASLEATMILVALPVISKGLSISLFQTSLLLGVFVIVEVALFVPFSLLFERIGTGKGMIAGSAVLFAGSLWAFLSPQFTPLLLARTLQAIGAAMVTPLSLTYASSLGSDEGRGHAIGINHMIVSLGYVLGLPLGGIASFFNWHYLFAVTSGLALVGLTTSFVLVDLKAQSTMSASALWPSIMFSGLILSVYSYLGLLVLTAGVVLTIMRFRIEAAFVRGSAAGFLHSLTRNAFAAFLVYYLYSLDFSSLLVGLLVLIYPISFTAVSVLAGKLGDVRGHTRVATIGFSIMALGALIILLDTFAAIVLGSLVLGIGSGVGTTANTAFTMNGLTTKDRIVGSGLRTVQGTVSMTFGLAIESAIFPSVVSSVIALVFLNVGAALIAGWTGVRPLMTRE